MNRTNCTHLRMYSSLMKSALLKFPSISLSACLMIIERSHKPGIRPFVPIPLTNLFLLPSPSQKRYFDWLLSLLCIRLQMSSSLITPLSIKCLKYFVTRRLLHLGHLDQPSLGSNHTFRLGVSFVALDGHPYRNDLHLGRQSMTFCGSTMLRNTLEMYWRSWRERTSFTLRMWTGHSKSPITTLLAMYFCKLDGLLIELGFGYLSS